MTAPDATTNIFLQSYLASLEPWLSRDDVTDILVNRPGEIWVETASEGMRAIAAPEVTEQTLSRLARRIAGASHQGINREQPLVSASLFDGARVQVIAPPATREGTAIAVRKHSIADLAISDLVEAGAFAAPPASKQQDDAALAALFAQGDIAAFLAQAVRQKRTIVLSGGTGSGKTTLLNALIKEIAADERLIVIEDAPEIKLVHPNALGLVAVRGEMGEARVSAEELLQATLRMRPDRILLGELRGAEALAFLRAVNTGHPGSITTVHADSPDGAIDQIALMALMSGVDLGWETVSAYTRQVIDIVVQLKRVNGRRVVTDVLLLDESIKAGHRPDSAGPRLRRARHGGA